MFIPEKISGNYVICAKNFAPMHDTLLAFTKTGATNTTGSPVEFGSLSARQLRSTQKIGEIANVDRGCQTADGPRAQAA